MIVARLHQMEVFILFPFCLPLSIKLHKNYEVCKQCFRLEFPSYFCCLGVVFIFFCVGKAFKARLGNGIFFPIQEQGSPTGEGVSIVPSFLSQHKEHNIVLPEKDHLCSQKSCLLLAHAASLGVNIKVFIFLCCSVLRQPWNACCWVPSSAIN